MRLAQRVQHLSPSSTLAVNARAAQLRAQGFDVIDFGCGEPDFATPAHVIEAGQQALAQGYTRYTATAGLPELRKAIVQWHARMHRLTFRPEQVTVSCGGKHALANLCMGLLDPEDEVLIPSPYWVSYPEMVRLAGARPVFLPLDAAHDFKMTPEQLQAAVGPRSRLLIVNSPSNPTGAAYTPEELQALAEVLVRHPQVWIVSDDIYSELRYDGQPFASLLHFAPELRDRCVVVNGVSKTFSMTGWRVGWTCAPEPLAAALTNIQSHTTSNAAAVCQRAALAALTGPLDFLPDWVATYARRRDRMVAELNERCGLACRRPEGAFYAFADVRPVLQRLAERPDAPHSCVQLATYLLEQAKVAVVPGEGFGAPGFIRLSYATSDGAIDQGLNRIAAALSGLASA